MIDLSDSSEPIEISDSEDDNEVERVFVRALTTDNTCVFDQWCVDLRLREDVVPNTFLFSILRRLSAKQLLLTDSDGEWHNSDSFMRKLLSKGTNDVELEMRSFPEFDPDGSYNLDNCCITCEACSFAFFFHTFDSGERRRWYDHKIQCRPLQ